MKKIIISISCLIVLLFALGSYSDAESINKNKNLHEAILKNISVYSDDNRYVTFYEDLDGDINREVLVYLYGPDFSKSGGNTLAVFTEDKGEYKLVSKIINVNMPVIISNSKTNNFNDIIVYNVGGGIENGYYTVLSNNDGRYPLIPSIQPKVNIDKIHVKKLINVSITNNSGEKLNKQ